WGTMPWPAIGPDVTGGYDQAGHVYKNPAHVCYDTSAKNADGSLIFDPVQCYPTGPADTTAPTVSITAPAAGSVVSGSVQLPPSAPSNVAATAVSFSQINLTWTAASDNVGVTGYRVLRCQGAGCAPTAQVAAPAGTSYSDTNLTPGTSYSYKVSAVDAATNVS